jgi:predicted RNA-binding protein associated with RNAse of E/G family
MNNLTLFRKRFIPDECVELKDDIILKQTDSMVVTKWHVIKERRDFSDGYSCFYLDRGYRISKFLKSDGSLLFWYFDVVDYDLDKETNTLHVIDLLADVVVYPSGKMRVVDLDELSEAFEKRLIDESLLKKSLLSLNRLLNEIYSDGIEPLSAPIEELIRLEDSDQ